MTRQPGSPSRGGQDDSQTGQAAVTELRDAELHDVGRRSSGGGSRSPKPSLRRASVASFWGQAWRTNLEWYAEYSDRLPWGKAYLAKGEVHDVQAEKGVIRAMVTRPRAEPYSIAVKIRPITPARWKYLVQQCAGKIDSMNDLLQGRLPDSVLQVLTDRAAGLFPYPAEIDFDTTCPEWASVGKHVRELLNSFGARLDEDPGLLFELRGVQPADLIAGCAAAPPSPVFPSTPRQEQPPTAPRPVPAERPIASPNPGKQGVPASPSPGRAAKAKPVAEPVLPAEEEGGSLSIIRRDDLIARHVPTEVIDFWIEQGLLCAHGADDAFLLTATIASRVALFEQMERRKRRR